jgi:hypothetical protein
MKKTNVAEAHHDGHTTKVAVLKVSYLLAVTTVAFMVPAFSTTPPAEWFIIPALLALQAIVLLACRIDPHEIVRPVWRLKWLFVFLILMYALLPAETPSDAFLEWCIPGVQWRLSVNLRGLVKAAVMCLQIISVLLASTVVRMTGTGSDLVVGLQAFRLPTLFVHSLDQTLKLLGGVGPPGGRDHGRHRGQSRARGHGRGQGQGQGPGQGPGQPHPGFFTVMRGLLRGDIGSFVQTIRGNIGLAGEQAGRKADRDLSAQLAHDVAVVSGLALCMASFKMLKFLPGLPFASGHKALLLFPLYVLAARLTHSRWGATAAGSTMGVIGFLQGDGRFGVLEILKHVGPGVVIDLADPLVRRLPNWALGYFFMGLLAAVARTATEFALVFMLGARAEVYIFPAARLVPNLLAGFLSGFITIFLLRAFGLSEQPKDADRDARARMTEDDGSEGAAQNSAMVAFPAEKLDAREGRISPQ